MSYTYPHFLWICLLMAYRETPLSYVGGMAVLKLFACASPTLLAGSIRQKHAAHSAKIRDVG